MTVKIRVSLALPKRCIRWQANNKYKVHHMEKEKKKKLKTCPKGHLYTKSSNCPVCPICEKERKPQEGFLSLLAAPARRALENKGILTLEELARFSEAEILQLHGIGPGSIPKLRNALSAGGLTFKR
jgi:predicted RecB family nuclease